MDRTRDTTPDRRPVAGVIGAPCCTAFRYLPMQPQATGFIFSCPGCRTLWAYEEGWVRKFSARRRS